MIGRALTGAHQYLDARLRASWQRALAGIGMIVVGLALIAAGVLIGHLGFVIAGLVAAATATSRGVAVVRAGPQACPDRVGRQAGRVRQWN